MTIDTVTIDARQLQKSFGNLVALNDCTLQISRGSRCVLLGPNGAGKSTFFNLVLGMLKPNSGTISVFGKTPGHISVRRRTGAMLQVSGVPSSLTVSEHLQLFRAYYPKPVSLSNLITTAGLEGLERRPFGSLSAGQQQRLNFALAICGNPELLVLDEPSSMLDIQVRTRLWDEIKKFALNEQTLLLATHNLIEAEQLGDRILIFHQGRIIADASPTQLRTMVGATEISVRTTANVAELAKNPWVKRVEHTKEHVRLYVVDAERTVWQLMQLDPELKDLQVQPATLQDAYLHLIPPETIQ